LLYEERNGSILIVFDDELLLLFVTSMEELDGIDDEADGTTLVI